MSTQAFHLRYFAQLTVYQILILIQIMLVIISLFQFGQKQQREDGSKRKPVNRHMKYMYIFVMILGTMIFLVVEWYGIADFLYDFAKYPLYCTSAAILGNVLLITYLFALYMFYLLRLHTIFGQSAYSLSNTALAILIIISVVIYLSLIICVFLFERSEPISINFAWNGKGNDYKPIIICKGEFSIGLDANLRIALQIIIVVGNIFYGWLF